MSPVRYAVGLSAAAIALSLVAPSAALSQEKPTAQQPGSMTSLKVTVVISRFQGEKKTGSLPFVLTLNTTERTSLRMDANVPMPRTVSEPGKPTVTAYEYRNLGTNIDCSAGPLMNDGRVNLRLTVSDTQVAADDGSKLAGMLKDVPRFQNFTSTASLLLRDGQTMEYTAATDKLSGEVIRLQVTLNVVK